MISRRKTIILLLVISIGGSITSSIFLIFTLNTGSWRFPLTISNQEWTRSLSCSTDGKYIVVGSGSDHIYLFEKSSSTPQWSYRANENIYFVDISANGQYIVAASEGMIYVFERTSSNPLWTNSTNGLTNVRISADGNYIFVSDGFGLFLYSRDSGIQLWFKSFAGHIAEISSNGSYLISILNGVVNFFHKSNSTPLWQYDTGEQVISGSAMTPNGEFFAVGGQDRKVHVFNNTGPVPIQVYSVGGYVRSLAISDDGKYISAGCSNGLYLFDKSNSGQLWVYPATEGREVDISSDGSTIVFGGVSDDDDQDFVYLFDKSSNTRLWEKKVINRVECIKISADGSIIAAVSSLNFYLLNSNNPTIDIFYEDKLNVSVIGLTIFVGIGVTTGLSSLILRKRQTKKEKIRLEKEKKEKEVLGVMETLDEKFKEWNEKEEESEKI